MYANALRAQSHEFMNKLHVILGLVQLKNYDELGNYIKDIAIYQQSEASGIINHIKNSVLAGFCSANRAIFGNRGLVGGSLQHEDSGYSQHSGDSRFDHRYREPSQQCP